MMNQIKEYHQAEEDERECGESQSRVDENGEDGNEESRDDGEESIRRNGGIGWKKMIELMGRVKVMSVE